MKNKVLADNSNENITIKWDGERFALVKKAINDTGRVTVVITLNPREMLDLINFVSALGKEG